MLYIFIRKVRSPGHALTRISGLSWYLSTRMLDFLLPNSAIDVAESVLRLRIRLSDSLVSYIFYRPASALAHCGGNAVCSVPYQQNLASV